MSGVTVAWMTDEAPPEVHALALGWMQASERARHDRFAFEHTRAEYRLARWLSRTVISRHAPVPPAAWRFVTNAHGRPEVAEPAEHRGLRFNVSHTPGLVAVAVAHGREVGLDVEDVTRLTTPLAIAHRYFAPRELAELRGLPDEGEQLARFFDLWTLKESYIKARGLGLALPLDCFAFDWADGTLGFSCDDRATDDPARWHFEQHRPTPRHFLAVAAERLGGEVPRVTIERVDPYAGSLS